MASDASQASLLLRRQLMEFSKQANDGFSAGLVGDDIFNWEVIIIGPPETLYEGKNA